MVAGGIGQTPFMALGAEYLGRRRYGEPLRSVPHAGRVTLCYGARAADLLAGVDDFRRLGVDVQISTDDGSAGHHGLVTDLVEQALDRSPGALVVCCGPERMMEAVAGICGRRGALPVVAGNADGLRHRDLLQLRHQGAPAGRLGLSADVRRRADFRRGRYRVVRPQ